MSDRVFAGNGAGDILVLDEADGSVVDTYTNFFSDTIESMEYSYKHNILVAEHEYSGSTKGIDVGSWEELYSLSEYDYYDIQKGGDVLVGNYWLDDYVIIFGDVTTGEKLGESEQAFFNDPGGYGEYPVDVVCDEKYAYIIGYYAEVVAFDIESQSIVWHNTDHQQSGGQANYAATAPEQGYLYYKYDNGYIAKIDRTDGSTVWTQMADDEKQWIIMIPRIPYQSQDVLYLIADQYLEKRNSSDGSLIWRTQAIGDPDNEEYAPDDFDVRHDGERTYIVDDSGGNFNVLDGDGNIVTDNNSSTFTQVEAEFTYDPLPSGPAKFLEEGKVGTVYTLVQYEAPAGGLKGRGRLKLTNLDKNNVIFEEASDSNYVPGDDQMFFVSETADPGANLGGDRIEVDFDVTDIDPDGYFRLSYGNTLEASHEHAVSPGIIEKFKDDEGSISSFYPANSDVIVNGSGLGVSLGDGTAEYEESVSISGLLNPGQVNDIQITSDTLGHIQAYVEGDVYRQIFGGG